MMFVPCEGWWESGRLYKRWRTGTRSAVYCTSHALVLLASFPRGRHKSKQRLNSHSARNTPLYYPSTTSLHRIISLFNFPSISFPFLYSLLAFTLSFSYLHVSLCVWIYLCYFDLIWFCFYKFMIPFLGREPKLQNRFSLTKIRRLCLTLPLFTTQTPFFSFCLYLSLSFFSFDCVFLFNYPLLTCACLFFCDCVFLYFFIYFIPFHNILNDNRVNILSVWRN